MYLSEEEDGTYTAIDGKQRLRAIALFMTNKLKLRSLERLEIADGVLFEDLPQEIANSLRLRPFIRVVTLLKQTKPALKYEVFLRLNRGGEILNPQEIRNVAYRGPLNDTIYKLGENSFLRSQLKITSERSPAYKDMSDAEYVLRFFTLRERLPAFSGRLAREMNSFMEHHQRAKPVELDVLERRFERAISLCKQLWNDNAFKRPDGGAWRDQLLAGVYDAQMLSVDRLSDDQVQSAVASENANERMRALFANPEFEKAVRTGTNTPARINYRVQAVTNLLQAL